MRKNTETGRARIGRLVRETPGCCSCGNKSQGSIRRDGKTIQWCVRCLPYVR